MNTEKKLQLFNDWLERINEQVDRIETGNEQLDERVDKLEKQIDNMPDNDSVVALCEDVCCGIVTGSTDDLEDKIIDLQQQINDLSDKLTAMRGEQ